MADKKYQAIIDAFDILATGTSKKTNGKINAVNTAKEACIGKATLYRYFKDHPELKESFNTLCKNGAHLYDDAPETIEQACALLKKEVNDLRVELAEVKTAARKKDKLKSHQIQLLWMENERLTRVINRLQEKSINLGNVIPIQINKVSHE